MYNKSMGKLAEEYNKLNDAQKAAVDAIEGPVLVLAGPGTGKTQLLSARVAKILASPDILPSNVLCLTFTDNAARNMLERLEQMVGKPAYHVNIHTFHSFGEQIINQYPDYFTDRPLLQAVDELGKYEILRAIFEKLPHSDPLSLKVGDEYVFLKDAQNAITWLKHNALSPDQFDEILKANRKFLKAADKLVTGVFKTTPSAKQIGHYQQLVRALAPLASTTRLYGFMDYGWQSLMELREALKQTEAGTGRFAPAMTAWRLAWLEKNKVGNYIFKDSGKNQAKLLSLVKIYETFQAQMTSQGFYDFEDMVMEVVQAIEKHTDLRLNLQERYQYVLVDEFQDTNKAQLRILTALGDNPVYEGRPNLMVVGDPNQAIYAFQGAENSNVLAFMSQYRDVKIINLTDNYRSTQAILDASIELIKQNPGAADMLTLKDLHLAAKAPLSVNILEHDVLSSELAQYQWVTDKIKQYLKSGTSPEEIAVIAPRHRYLERLMPYLATAKIPVAYERRENILDSPLVVQLLKMAELVVALADGNYGDADALFAEVLNYRFWKLPPEELIEVSLEAYDQRKHWIALLIKHKDPVVRSTALWLTALAKSAKTEPLEYILDALSGSPQAGVDSPDEDESSPTPQSKGKFVSPFMEYYFSDRQLDTHTDDYLAYLGQLSTLRQHLRSWKPKTMLYIADLIEFVRLHRQAGIKIVDNNPHTQTVKAVQVMTAYKAKGLEFSVVFAINAQDEVWGPKARGYNARIRLPKNLPIKPAGDTDDDKLRLFFVALTRAKHTLHITSYTHNLDNKLSLGLSFIGGNSPDSDPIHPAFRPKYIRSQVGAEAARILSTDWAYRYRQIIADKPSLFEPILERYKLSVTHLNNFLDVVNGGPEYFLLHNLLRFPAAMSAPAAYGDAIHKTLDWIYTERRKNGAMPLSRAWKSFFVDILARKHLPSAEFVRYQTRGLKALAFYLENRHDQFKSEDIIEHSFAHEGVVIDGARLTGKIDKIIRRSPTELAVIDFKTGKPSSSWQGSDDYERRKLHRYEQQLLFYKLLVDNSASYSRRYQLNRGALEFIEADENREIAEPLELKYSPQKITEFARLLKAVWEKIMTLDFPDTSVYSKDYNGLLQFESDLVSKK